MLAPIALFSFNRPYHLGQTLAYLKNNPLASQSDLFVFSDGPRREEDIEKVKQVRDLLKSIEGFRKVEIIEREKNMGLAQNIITGVTHILQDYERIIVMEDDILSLPSFLNYSNDALDYYENDDKIFSVSGYNYPIPIPASYKKSVYISPRASSLGWSTWRNRWELADWTVQDFQEFKKSNTMQKGFNLGGPDLTSMLVKQQKGKINSWAIRWAYTHFKQHKYCLFPVNSKIQHIGADGSGSETPKTKKLDVVFEEANYQFTHDLELNEKIMHGYYHFFKQSLFRRFINYFLIKY